MVGPLRADRRRDHRDLDARRRGHHRGRDDYSPAVYRPGSDTRCGDTGHVPVEHLRRVESRGLDGADHLDQPVPRTAERRQRLVHGARRCRRQRGRRRGSGNSETRCGSIPHRPIAVRRPSRGLRLPGRRRQRRERRVPRDLCSNRGQGRQRRSACHRELQDRSDRSDRNVHRSGPDVRARLDRGSRHRDSQRRRSAPSAPACPRAPRRRPEEHTPSTSPVATTQETR